MKYKALIFVAMSLFTSILPAAGPAEAVRPHAQSAAPYTFDKVRQTFSKTAHGGIQHVVAKAADDTKQIESIRAHLRKMVDDFRKGDFSAMASMPGLARFKKAEIDDVRYEYRPLGDGAQIHYASEYPELVQALHEWFDVQSVAYGNDEIPGHGRHHATPAE